jgi:hypothetical protein
LAQSHFEYRNLLAFLALALAMVLALALVLLAHLQFRPHPRIVVIDRQAHMYELAVVAERVDDL